MIEARTDDACADALFIQILGGLVIRKFASIDQCSTRKRVLLSHSRLTTHNQRNDSDKCTAHLRLPDDATTVARSKILRQLTKSMAG
jgi:hypothetical protein